MWGTLHLGNVIHIDTLMIYIFHKSKIISSRFQMFVSIPVWTQASPLVDSVSATLSISSAASKIDYVSMVQTFNLSAVTESPIG